jgi:hypothetical protein
MNEMDSLEQEMREWKPRKPSERLARRLFARADLFNASRSAPAASALRRAEFWSWLTPVSACALTILAAVGSANYRGEALEGKAVAMFNAASPDAAQMARLSQLDENVRWNVCPELARPAGSAPEAGRAAATNLNGGI